MQCLRKWLLNPVQISIFCVAIHPNSNWLKVERIFSCTHDFQVEVGWSDWSWLGSCVLSWVQLGLDCHWILILGPHLGRQQLLVETFLHVKSRWASRKRLKLGTNTLFLPPICYEPKWVTWLSLTSINWGNIVGGTAKPSGPWEEWGVSNSIHQKTPFILFFSKDRNVIVFSSLLHWGARHEGENIARSGDLLWSLAIVFSVMPKLLCMMGLLVRLVAIQILSLILKFIKSESLWDGQVIYILNKFLW